MDEPQEPSAILRLLSQAWGRLGGSRAGRALALARPVARAWVRASVLRSVRTLPDDVTVLIGVRNRTDHRIVNALRSIREQVYPWGRVTALVVDYGSDLPEARRLSEICGRIGAEVLRVEATGPWSRGRCLNVGLRHVRTKYVMTSDADIVLSPRYLADAVATSRTHPLSIVCASMLDLPEDSVAATRHAACGEAGLDLHAWRSRCRPRFDWELHPSIAVTLTAFHRAIRGYDEFYEGWGREDDDLMRRFSSLGLRPTAIPGRSFYLHQWHPKYEGLTDGERARAVERNQTHFERSRSILRNDESWGARGPTAPGSGRPHPVPRG